MISTTGAAKLGTLGRSVPSAGFFHAAKHGRNKPLTELGHQCHPSGLAGNAPNRSCPVNPAIAVPLRRRT